MIQKIRKDSLTLLLVALLFGASQHSLYAQGERVKEVARIYDSLRSHQIEFPKTVLAIVILETGWLQCKSCAFSHNNLFGFRTNKDFLHFASVTESIRYMKRWQTKYYNPWKTKNPNGTYYEYLTYIGYCNNMDIYIRDIKTIENWISLNIETAKGAE